jgi:purine-binding chemotaxis protein CheW
MRNVGDRNDVPTGLALGSRGPDRSATGARTTNVSIRVDPRSSAPPTHALGHRARLAYPALLGIIAPPAVASPAIGPSLLCRAATQWCALPIAQTREIMRPLPVEPIRGAPAFVLGLTTIRGQPTPVVDLSLLVSGARTPPTRFIALRGLGRPLALATGEVLGVRTIPPASLAELPPLLQDVEFIAGIGRLDAELLLVLQAGRLASNALWPEEPAP